jgi:ATP-dependent nuclease, subunit B
MYLNGIFNILEEDSLQYFKEDKNMPPKIEKELLDKIYLEGNIHTSISRLEKYAECPFSYHLRYGLNIKDRSNQSNNYFANIGTFLHEIIKETFDYIKENNINEKITNGGLPKKSVYTLKEELLLTQDKELEDNVQKYIYEIENIVNKSIEKVKQKEQFQEFKFKKNNEIVLNKIENEVNKICLDINEGIRLSEFKILKNEATFGSGKRDYENIVYDIDSKSKVFLEGAIDRIDVSDINEFRIIDYKSSDKTIEIPKVINGLSLQLITYLSVIEEKLNLKPTAMLYKRLLYGIETKKEKMDNLQLIKKSKQDLKMTGKLIIDTTEEQEELYVHDVNLNVKGKVKSEIVDIEKTKDNIISKTKMRNILEREEYEDIKNKAFDKIKEISKNILRRKCRYISI